VHLFIERSSFPETFCLKNMKASPTSATGWGSRPAELSMGVKT